MPESIHLLRPIASNRGDVISRYGFTRLMSTLPQLQDRTVYALSSRQKNEFPIQVSTIPIGWADDLWPTWREIRCLMTGGDVWWACGQDFQDHTSALLIPAVLLKFWFLKLFDLRIRIVAQGAGPINHAFSRWCVRRVLSLVDDASYRDEDSLTLVNTISPKTAHKTYLTADMALLAHDRDEPRVSVRNRGPVIGVSVRRWFSFTGGIVPLKYKLSTGLASEVPGQAKMTAVVKNMAAALDSIAVTHGATFVFIPMYPPGVDAWTGDEEQLRLIRAGMAHSDRVSLFSTDCTPEELLRLFDSIDLMVGTRLHSTIIATSFGIPSVHLAYSPKGYSYFNSIGQSDMVLPLDSMAEEGAPALLCEKVATALESYNRRSVEIMNAVNAMRGDILRSWKSRMDEPAT